MNKLIAIVFVVATSLTAHLMFSRFGFNPTDDGYHLAGARRIVDGQIPHRDFVTIRPPLTFYLHAPVVAWGGEHTLMISRYVVWAEISITVLAWLMIANKSLRLDLFKSLSGVFFFFLAGSLAFIYNSHNFPIMAWNTIDAILFSSLGIWLIVDAKSKRTRVLGYMLVGATPLFRQSFVFFPMATFLILFKKKHFIESLSMAVPGLLYIGFLLITQALSPAITQLVSYSEFSFSYLLDARFTYPLLAGIFIGWLSRSKNNAVQALSIIFAILFFTKVSSSLRAAGIFIGQYSYYLQSFGLGWLMTTYSSFKSRRAVITLILLTLALSITSSISLGYRSVALASGTMTIGVLAMLYSKIHQNRLLLILSFPLFIILFLNSTGDYIFSRTNGVYRDKTAPFLTYDLGPALPGATGILTNKLTHDYLMDLQKITESVDRTYMIMPDNAIHWMSSQQPNPLSIDWPQSTELTNPMVMSRVKNELLDHLDRGGVVIVQKVSASTLSNGAIELPKNQYSLVNYTKNNYQKISESEFFEVYAGDTI